MQQPCGRRYQCRGLQHAARTGLAAGLIALCRPKAVDPALPERHHIGPGRGILPHNVIHGRGDGHRGLRGQADSRQQVIRATVRQPGNKISRGGSDQQDIRPAGQLDMPHRSLGRGIEHIGVYRLTGEGLQGKRCNKCRGTRRHDHTDRGALFTQAPDQLGTLVGGYTASHAQQDVFPG